jgi:hypothetical protein
MGNPMSSANPPAKITPNNNPIPYDIFHFHCTIEIATP